MLGFATPSGFTLIPPPIWYNKDRLPCFYRQNNGQIHVLPLNSFPKGDYTENDVLDLLLYYAPINGFNRADSVKNGIASGSATHPAWTSSGGWSSYVWATAALKKNQWGDGSGNWADVPTSGRGIDGALTAKLQARYIEVQKPYLPWLADMQTKGGGIDLMTLPQSTSKEIPRPDWYPKYLPSLFINAGEPYEMPAGSVNSYPKIMGRSGNTTYIPDATDTAAFMLYAQAVVATMSPQPYPMNWYLNDTVNGATCCYYKITLAASPGNTDSQIQGWGINGDILYLPKLDADPYASGFSKTLQKVVGGVVSFFAGKVPGGSTLMNSANSLAKLGGMAIQGGGDLPPETTFSMNVFKAANAIADALNKQNVQKQEDATTKTNYMLVGGIILVVILLAMFVLSKKKS